jgi:DNA modification methylase
MQRMRGAGISVQTCVTSPPYFGLRDYGVSGQIGLEQSPQDYVSAMVEVFRGVRDILADDGTLWLNIGDSYAGSGKGGNPTDSPHQKQKTNHGSLMSTGDTARQAAVTNITRNVAGYRAKQLLGIPWRVAFALQDDGWYLRQDIIWHKPNVMPESVRDRCTKAHEYIFMLTKNARYFYDADAIKEPASEYDWQDRAGRGALNDRGEDVKYSPNGKRPFFKGVTQFDGKHADKQRGHSRRHAGFNERWDSMSHAEQCSGMRNKRDVWTVAPANYPGAHFATFPSALIEPCIMAGSRPGDVVLDPFMGSGTTAEVAQKLGRQWVGCELNPAYVELQKSRTAQQGMHLA